MEQQDSLKTSKELKTDGENRIIKTVALTFIDHENEETVKKTLRNFTLVELKKALKEYTGNREYLTISMRVDKNASARDVSEVKQALREAYALNINMTNK